MQVLTLIIRHQQPQRRWRTSMIHDRMDILLYLLQKGANIHTKFYEIDLNNLDHPTFPVDILYKLLLLIAIFLGELNDGYFVAHFKFFFFFF